MNERFTVELTKRAIKDPKKLGRLRSDVMELSELLKAHGWAKRNAPERSYSSGGINDRGFIKGGAELHSFL
ncbi:MAG TPA: hypothetical protein GXX30_01655 [Firmicutes bacterium]|nr:hypothetical protein [Candidatus Fermentithermobacillaceae bacterium]